jgi:hypothetical protein
LFIFTYGASILWLKVGELWLSLGITHRLRNCIKEIIMLQVPAACVELGVAKLPNIPHTLGKGYTLGCHP